MTRNKQIRHPLTSMRLTPAAQRLITNIPMLQTKSYTNTRIQDKKLDIIDAYCIYIYIYLYIKRTH